MKYINTKTQAVIDTACVVKGGSWVPEDNQPKKSEEPKKKSTRQKSGE